MSEDIELLPNGPIYCPVRQGLICCLDQYIHVIQGLLSIPGPVIDLDWVLSLVPFLCV